MKTSSHRALRAFCGIALLALGLVPVKALAAIPSPEKLLPDDTLVMVTIPDFSKAREIYNTSPQTEFWKDPAMKPFRDKFMEKLKDELINPLQRELGVNLNEYANLPQGQLTFALTRNEWQGPGSDASLGVLLLLDARDNGEKLKTNLAELRRKWLDSGKTLKTEKIRDVEFWVLPISKDDLPDTLKRVFAEDEDVDEEESDAESESAKAELVIGQYESLLVIGNATSPVEKVAVHLSGGAMPALADLAAYESVHAAMFRESPLYGWANLKTFVDLLTSKTAGGAADEDEENPFAMFEPEKIITALGLKGLRTFGFNVQSSTEGVTAEFAIGIPESSREGIFKLFPNESKEAGPPPFVPADTAKFQRWRIDGQKAWTTFRGIVNGISPQVAQMLDFMIDTANTAAREKDPSFDIQKDLFGNLGDDMISYEKAAKGETFVELGSPPSLMLIGSPRPESLAAALKHVFVLVNQEAGSPKEREFLGRKIYSIPSPSMMAMGIVGEPEDETMLHYAASGSYVAVTTDVAMLEEYLRNTDGQQQALRERPGLTAAIAKVGGSSNGFFAYENQVETTRPLLEMLRQGKEEEPPMLAPGIPMYTPESALQKWFDFSLLPPFEKIAKYFHFTVYSGSASVDGIRFRMFSPVPPELRK